MTLRYASIFAGIGGFDLGFDRAGLSCTAQVEINKHCNKVLERNWPGVPRLGDVIDVAGRDLGPIDVLAGGFPCQDVSKANAYGRKGLDGERSGLFWEFSRLAAEVARLLDETKPLWCVVENVPGLLTSNGGRDMGAIVGALGDLGYGWAYRVLDCASLGTPARRRRLVLVGCLGGSPAGPAAVLDVTAGGSTHPGRDHSAWRPSRPQPGTSTEEHLGRMTFVKSRRPRSKTDFATWVQKDVANCVTGFDQGDARATTLIVEGDRLRRLTWTEQERLLGFPDGHTEGQAASHRGTQLGNAVNVNLAHWLGHRLVAWTEQAGLSTTLTNAA